jgi:hypothetical protein
MLCKNHGLNSPIVSPALPVPITALRLAEVLSLLTAKSSSDGETYYSIEKDKILATHFDQLPIAQAVAVPILLDSSSGSIASSDDEASDPTDSSSSSSTSPRSSSSSPPKKRGLFRRAFRKIGKFVTRHSAAIANTTLCVLSIASLTVLVVFTGPFGGILLVLGGLALGAVVGGIIEARAYHRRQSESPAGVANVIAETSDPSTTRSEEVDEPQPHS